MLFRPVLASATAAPQSPGPDDFRFISITPRKWFASANGTDRVYFDITVRDGRGNPLPGKQVRLGSSLGTVVDGGITGFDGKALGYVYSSSPGEATVNARLDAGNPCEFARSPITAVTFTPPASDSGYLPPSAAPYLNEGIQIEPMPIMRGVPTRLSVKLTNPNNFPVIVDGTFSYLQSSIGLAFGPLAEITGTLIPANGQGVVQTIWTPQVDGSYCIQFDFSARQAGAVVSSPAALQAGGSTRLNLKTFPAPLKNSDARKTFNKAKKITGTLGNANDGLTLVTDPAGFVGGFIPGQLFGHILDFNFDSWGKAADALEGDPPRQDYKTITVPQIVSFAPLQAGSGVSAAKAAAANQLLEAALDMVAYARAAQVANDRYGGASQAHDLQWASAQVGALRYYVIASAERMPLVADKLDAYVQVLLAENPNDIVMTADLYAQYQDRLRTQGFNADEIAAARLLGYTDEEIEAVRQARIQLDPADMAGSVTQRMTQLADTLRYLSDALLRPPEPPFIVIGGAGGSSQLLATAAVPTTADNYARIFPDETTIAVGNPHIQTETVQLRVRPLDVPPDWIVSVSPVSVTLAPGQGITATVSIAPGSPMPQGTLPRVAVEGYIGSELIGGVVVDTLVPNYVYFDGKLRVYLPTVLKR